MITLKSKDEITLMQKSGRIVGEALVELRKRIRPGVRTRELDAFARDYLEKRGSRPAFLGYHGYPAVVCVSVNDEVVHGIPGDRVLEEGDVVGIDIGGFVDGYCADTARTFPVGKVRPQIAKLLEVGRRSLDIGIAHCVVGNHISDIGHAVQTYVEGEGFSVVRDFVGHGIGRAMHEEPQVPNYGKPGQGPRIVEGMCLALEPMVNEKGAAVRVLEDGWTVVTCDGGWSVHFEDSVAVTPDGPLNLTRVEE